MKKKFLSIIALLVLCVQGRAVTVETTASLTVYYPDFSRIDLVCGQMPSTTDETVDFWRNCHPAHGLLWREHHDAPPPPSHLAALTPL
jgi:hypothetical protein